MKEKPRGMTAREEIAIKIVNARSREDMFSIKNKAEKKGLGAMFNERVEKDFKDSVTKIAEKNIKASTEIDKLKGSKKVAEAITKKANTEVGNLKNKTKKKIEAVTESKEGGEAANFDAEYTAPELSETAAAFDAQHLNEAATAGSSTGNSSSSFNNSPDNSGAINNTPNTSTGVLNNAPSAADNEANLNPTGTLSEDSEDTEPGEPAPRVLEAQIPGESAELTSTREEYFEAHKEFMKARGEGESTWDIIGKTKNLRTEMFGGEIKAEDVKNTAVREKFVAAEEKYNKALLAHGEGMLANKKAELEASGKTGDELTELLNEYKRSEVFQTLVMDEKQRLIKSNEELPGKTRQILGAFMNKYSKWNKAQKIAFGVVVGTAVMGTIALTSTAIATGSLAAGGAAAGATLAKAITGKALLTKAATILAGQTVGSAAGLKMVSAKNWLGNKFGVFDKGVEKANREFERAQNSEMDEPFDMASLKYLKRKFDTKLQKEKLNKNWKIGTDIVTQLGTGMAVGITTSHFMGSAIDSYQHSHPNASVAEINNHAEKTLAAAKSSAGETTSGNTQTTEAKLAGDGTHTQQTEATSEATTETAKSEVEVKTEGNVEPKAETVTSGGEVKAEGSITHEADATTSTGETTQGTISEDHELKSMAEKLNLKNPDDAVVHQNEGISHAFKRQLENNPELAKNLGYTGSSSEKHAALVKILHDTGYITDKGDVRVLGGDNAAYLLKASTDGHATVFEYHNGEFEGVGHNAGGNEHQWEKTDTNKAYEKFHEKNSSGSSKIESTSGQKNFSLQEMKAKYGEDAVTSKLRFDGGHEDPNAKLGQDITTSKLKGFVPGRSTLIIPNHNIENTNPTLDDNNPPEDNQNGQDDTPPPEDKGGKHHDPKHHHEPKQKGHSLRWWKKHGGDEAMTKDGWNKVDDPKDLTDTKHFHKGSGQGHSSGAEGKPHLNYRLSGVEMGRLMNLPMISDYSNPSFLALHANDPEFPLYKTLSEYIQQGHKIGATENISQFLYRMKMDPSGFVNHLAETDKARYLWLKANFFL